MTKTQYFRCPEHESCVVTLDLMPEGSVDPPEDLEAWVTENAIAVLDGFVAVHAFHTGETPPPDYEAGYTTLAETVEKLKKELVLQDTKIAFLEEWLNGLERKLTAEGHILEVVQKALKELALETPGTLEVEGMRQELMGYIGEKADLDAYALYSDVEAIVQSLNGVLNEMVKDVFANLDGVREELAALAARVEHVQPVDFTVLDERIDKLEEAVKMQAELISELRDDG